MLVHKNRKFLKDFERVGRVLQDGFFSVSPQIPIEAVLIQEPCLLL
jgi:hypothetical protein